MAKDNSYHDYIVYDILGHIDGITSRAMFSGWGIYRNSVIVAIVADGELYFKGNKELKELYMQKEYYPFRYNRGDKVMQMNYISVKVEDLEDREEMKRRVEESYGLSRGGT